MKKEQQKIMEQLNDITSLASDLMKKIQEDQDSEMKDQLKEFIDVQKNKLIQQIQSKEESKDEEEDLQFNLDNGDLRPLNQIQSFF